MFFFNNKKGNLDFLYRMHTVDASAFSLIFVFIPIYFLSLGYSLTQVFLYYIVQNTFLLIFSFVAGLIGTRYGIHRILLIRLPLLFIFLFILLSLKTISFPILLLAVIDGWQSAFYWVPLNIIFTKSTNRKKIGSDLGKLFALPQLATIFAPAIGGLFISYFNFYFLFLITIIIFSFSILPFLKIRNIDIDFKFKIKDGLKLYRNNRKYFFAEVFNNFGEEVDGLIWPIFIYLSLYNVSTVGFAATILSLGSSFFTIYMGKAADKFSKERLIKAGAVLVAITWFLKYYYNSELAFYILSLVTGFVFVVFKLPYYSRLFGIPNKPKVDEFIIFREIPVNLARVIMFSAAILFAANLKIMFIFAGMAYIFFLFI